MIPARPSRRRHSRLARLETLLASSSQAKQDPDPQTEEEWLAYFRQWGVEGLYRQEPDFSWLLGRYERALEKAKLSSDPLFDPPNRCATHLAEAGRMRDRRDNWRFPELSRSFQAMLAMTDRAMSGEPPVTRAEWEALSAWYQSVRASLPSSSGAILLPTGQWIGQAGIERELRAYDGLIISYTVTVLKELHQLHEHFGQSMN